LSPRPVIIDTDPGTDDALAIAIALQSPELEILGLTTVAGNVSIADATRNALSVLQALGRPDIGVWEGADGPPEGIPRYAYRFHGETGLTVDLGTPIATPQQGTAVDFIVEAARKYPGALEIIALGPLTNIAAAMNSDADLPALIRRIGVMGGAFDCPGNVTPHAEFNFYCDPASAERVLNSGVRAIVIGLDVCDRVQVGPDASGLASGDSLAARLSTRLLDAWLLSHQGDRFSMCDPLAVAVALDPALATLRTGKVSMTVPGNERGRSTFSKDNRSVDVAFDIDVTGALAAIESRGFGGD
jgi:inosine-uridine nucleoside N-ribohydrolase